ncbi:MAG TPA: S-layer homology domain-containing protein [bacterium]|nr:S-layer homology domain-containing protein [bacterium]
MISKRLHRLRMRGVPAISLLAALVLVAPAWGAIFTDINGLPMQRAIERLAAKGVLRGTGDRFNPTGTVTRGELALYLFRAFGLSGEGAKLPSYKDSGDIAAEQRIPIASMTGMGTVSPQKVELRKGAVLYTLTVDKAVYSPDQRLMITFTIENTSDQAIRFEYANTQFWDFIIRSPKGEEVAKWSLGRPFLPVTDAVPLAAKQKIVAQTLWRQLDQQDDVVEPGRYEIAAIHTTKANPTSLSLFFNKGVMSGFPDGTFRPKQQATRLEVATIAAHGLGLADAPASALNVTDVNAVPQEVRGTVAAALEKRLINIVGNREFRPAQPATRAELAQVLDAVMDILKRYNFAKGTLKDPVSGTPPQLTIEDERKSIRTFRVARSHVVYRNDRPAELRDLRPGDTLAFLNVGDVGDVAYIEATGR